MKKTLRLLTLALSVIFLFSVSAKAQTNLYTEGSDLSNTSFGANVGTITSAGTYTVVGSLTTPSDYQDWFQFTLSTGLSLSNVTYAVTGASSFDGLWNMNAYNSLGISGATSGSMSMSGSGFSYPFSAGTFFIMIGANFSVGNSYTITMTVTGSSTPTPGTVAFTGGTPQTLSVCQSSSANSINSKLQASDTKASETLTWTTTSGPSHGSISGSGATATSIAGNSTPSGLSYTPTAGYSGTDAFTMKVSNGTNSATTVINVTVNPAPVSITGTTSLCQGTTTNLTDAAAGGTWTSSNTGVASVGATTGVVTGTGGGTTVITHTTGCGTNATATVTVTPTPVIITGTSTVCVSATTNLTDAAAGGTWTSSNTANATVNTSGVVTGVAAGTATITHATGCGTNVTRTVSIIAAPVSITGTPALCQGTTTNLTDATTGGTWTSSNTSIATVGAASGVVTGAAGGTAVITHATGCGTNATLTVSVTPSPVSITGTATVCQGTTTNLTDAAFGGTWISGNTAVATVGAATGVVTGVTGGTSIITHTTGCGLDITRTVTVTPNPVAITGTATLCQSTTTNLTDAAAGGTWTSSNTGVATVSATGIVTGTGGGTSVITHSTGCGTNATLTVSVTPNPVSITGLAAICQGATTNLADVAFGGTWISGNTAVATVSTIGTVLGLTGGTSIITHTTGCGTDVTRTVTVTPNPVAITGTATLCQGTTTSLTDAAFGGTWTSSNTANATVSATGVVTGVAGGTAVITHATGCGTNATLTVSVTPNPVAITGTATVCQGATTSLTDAAFGGTWTSGNTSIATVSATGVVTGIAGGTATITHTTGCGTDVTRIVSVTPIPVAITGTATVCQAATTNLTDVSFGGTWTSGNTAVATVVAATGVVTGVSGGTAVITHTTGCGANATRTVSVTPIPVAITGTAAICQSTTTSLTDAAFGGTWTSGNTAVATVGAATGVVSGLTGGTAVITHTTGCGTEATRTVSVTPIPVAITGTATVCQAATTNLTDAAFGGTWTSSNTAIATVGATTGVVSGIGGGTAVITHTTGCGANTIRTVSVTPIPVSITGTAVVCQSATTSLTDAAFGGTWTSGNTAVATIGAATGMVTGVAGGTSIITHTTGCGTDATRTVSVTPIPVAVTGTTTVCQNATTSLTDVSFGGTWSSSNTAVATVNAATGVVTGVSGGISVIVHTTGCGTNASATVSVTPVPVAITGTAVLCEAATTSLFDLGYGGTWTSSNTSVATVNSTTGFVNGLVAGNTVITHTTGCGTNATRTVTVNPLPAAVTGINDICNGLTSVYANDTALGIWSSSNTSVATIGTSTGLATGISAGSATISYTLTTGCYATKNITIDPLPAAIGGTLNVCKGLTTTLTNTGGGTWSSSNISIAVIGAGTGVVTGVVAGSVIITYTLPVTGCITSSSFTVNPLPAPISGVNDVCLGGTSALTDAGGGTWSSSNTAIATVGVSTGVVSGLATGTSVITYTLPTGCIITAPAIVNPLPAATSGPGSVCIGSTVTLFNSIGGTWSSSSAATASVGIISGVVTGIAPGSTIITFTLPTGCTTTKSITVNSLPYAPVGATSVCEGGIAFLAPDPATLGGTWSSSNSGIVTVDAGSGLASGIAAGTATITYTLPTGCISTAAFTVDPLPAAITGATSVCIAATTSLSSATSGGTWISGTSGVVSIDAATGIATGISPGTAYIIYMLPTGCFTATNITANVLPVASATQSGNCIGSSLYLTSTTFSTVTWKNNGLTTKIISSPGGATADTLATTVSGSYTATVTDNNGCVATTDSVHIITVGDISGPLSVCAGLNITLADTSAGGTWASTDATVAAIDPATGIVAGVAAGTATIIYTTPAGCNNSAIVTVNPLPAATTGSTNVCAGQSIGLTNAAGGTWSSSSANAAVDVATGTVTGVTPGTADITYTSSLGCTTAATVTVNALPVAYSMTGGGHYCSGGLGLPVGISNTDTGISYQLYTGVTPVPVGTALAGTGTAMMFGTYTGSGSYTVIATDIITGCISYSATTTGIVIDPLPVVYTLSGGGSYCAGGAGVIVGIAGSESGVEYTLLNSGLTTAGPVSGTGAAVDFGLQATAGTYSVAAVNTVTGCIAYMADSVTVSINPVLVPTIALAPTSGSTFCLGTVDTFVANVTNEGTAPVYQWSVNGTIVAAAGPSYTYVPASGDVVTATLTSNATCVATPATVAADITVTVVPVYLPSVAISASEGYSIAIGQADTFTAVVTNAGPAPTYQWYRNTTPVSGATTTVYWSNTLANNDSITCVVYGTGACSFSSYNAVIIHIATGINETAKASDIRVVPNPNKGIFTVKGTMNSADDQEATLEVTNMLGQVIYSEKVMTRGGAIAQQVQLGNNIASGMYLLNVRTATDSKVFHVVIEQ